MSVTGPAGDLSYVREDAKDPVTFTLTLSGRRASDVTVDYTTGQAQVLSGLAPRQGINPATAGEDYTTTTGSITFSPGVTTSQVTVQLTDDDVSEETEFFGFKVSNVENARLQKAVDEEVVDVGLLDDDLRGVTIDPTSISLDEPGAGETAVASSYTVKLKSKPTDTVTVTIGGTSSAVTLSATTLTFTTSSWNTNQTVTVTPVEDDNATGETITLTHTLSGGDYAGIAADSVTVNVEDDDTAAIVLSPASLTVTEGDTSGESYTVKLATQPSATVTVTIGGHSGTDLTLNKDALTFTTTDWDTSQTITVKAADDGGGAAESETLTHTASGGGYAGVAKSLPVTITDDDMPSVVNCDSAIWCADLEFNVSGTSNGMSSLRSKSLDSDFEYNGVTYGWRGISVYPYGHNIPVGTERGPPFGIPERTKFSMQLLNMDAPGDDPNRFRMPNDDWMYWAFHVSTTKDGQTLTAEMRLSEGRFSQYWWQWFGSDLEALRAV